MSQGVTRRGLLKTGAAGAAGAAVAGGLPSAAAAKPRRRPPGRRADVVVVGAGLSGLSTARHLVAAGKSVIVLEARDRVGGRTLNHQLGGGKVIEVGGEWVGPTQDHVIALAKELGIGTFKTYNEGNNVYYANGTLLPYAAGGPLGPVPPDPTGGAEAEEAIVEINQMAATIDVQAPWNAAGAVSWDSQTTETWKQNNLHSPNGQALFDVGIEAVFAAECRDVSLLFVLFYTASATNEATAPDINRLFSTPGGAQDSRLVGGSQLISIRLARQLSGGRGRVLLNQPVRIISQTNSGVRVTTDHLTVSAKHVVVTGPPAITALIRYEPDLPWMRAQLTQRYPQGSVIKCEAIYDRPFWREQGLTGQAVSLTGPVKVTFDNSPPDGSPGVLLGFIEGQAARQAAQLSPADRRRAVLQNFVTYFGQQAANPRQFVEMNWSNEPWTRGCYVGYTAPGVLLDYGTAIRAPIGRIHWAGAETSDYWNGYMDGAVRSGERAAHEVLAAL